MLFNNFILVCMPGRWFPCYSMIFLSAKFLPTLLFSPTLQLKFLVAFFFIISTQWIELDTMVMKVRVASGLTLLITMCCRSDIIEFVLCESLFPEKHSINDIVKHWVGIFSGLDKVEVKALEKVLEQKQRYAFAWVIMAYRYWSAMKFQFLQYLLCCRLQQEMQKYLSFRLMSQV